MSESLRLQIESTDVAMRLAAGETCLAAESELYLKVIEQEEAGRERKAVDEQQVAGRECDLLEDENESIERKNDTAREAGTGAELNAWIAERLDLFRKKHASAVEALRLARAAHRALPAATTGGGTLGEGGAHATAGASAAEPAGAYAAPGASEEVEAYTASGVSEEGGASTAAGAYAAVGVSEEVEACSAAGASSAEPVGASSPARLWTNDLWELAYSVARWEGCIAFYEAYAHRAEPERAAVHFEEALLSFQKVKSLLAERKDYSMANLEELGSDVAYLSHFLEGWDTISRRWVDIRPYYYVLWEHVDRYEAKLGEMAAALGL